MTTLDAHIIQRTKDGDKEAFRIIVQHYQRMVFSLALKMVCDEDDAKDIVQETFIKVWVNLRKYNEQQDFTTWIYTIATRLCLDRLKKKKLTIPLPEDYSVLHHYYTEADGQRTLENKEWISIVRTITDGLSEKQKLVFTLIQLEGLSSSEAEQITGMDAKQIKSNLYVARQTVKERLKKRGYE